MYKKELTNYFRQILTPAVLLILLSEVLKALGMGIALDARLTYQISVVVFVLAALSALGIPIVIRLLFVKRVKDLKSVDSNAWLQYEKQSILFALLTAYLFVIASVLQFSNFFYASIFLLALYAGYYYFPSDKRVKFEKKLFRIKEAEE